MQAAAHIDPAKSFLDHKGDYDSSELLALLRRMPKGGVLHAHGIASGDFSTLVDQVRSDDHFFVWLGGDEVRPQGKLTTFKSPADAGPHWAPASSVPRDQLYRYLTLPSGLPSVEVCWQQFGRIWARVHDVANCVPFYFGRGGFLWSILEIQLKANVIYLEIKEAMFCPHTGYGQSAVGDDEWTDCFRDTVTEFQREHPTFLGARLVLVSLKSQSVEDVCRDFRRAVQIKRRLPDYVAGFDLAGPEDAPKPIVEFAAMFEEESRAAAEAGVVLPLMLHAGETNVPEGTQIIDAVAIRCKRIGHGFALARHPALMDEVIAQGICLECCPISNQVLGYVPNLANHAALGLLRGGVPMCLSPDDPGMWHYADVSYDFAAAAKAWHLGLVELKALARNSLAFSSLEGGKREAALAAWQAQWAAWVEGELRTAGISLD